MSESGSALTVAQIAERFSVTPKTVYGWIKRGLVTAVRLPGGDYRFLHEDVERIGTKVGGAAIARTDTDCIPAPHQTRSVARDPFQLGRAAAAQSSARRGR